MRKWISSIGLLSLASLSFAAEPIIDIGFGLSSARLHQDREIISIAPFTNHYFSKQSDNELIYSLGVGLRFHPMNAIVIEPTINYAQNEPYIVQGNIYQFSNPSLNDLGYEWRIMSRRLFAKIKILYDWQERWFPYVTLGAGLVINRNYGYREVPLTSAAVTSNFIFQPHTNRNLGYSGGVGLGYAINPALRLSIEMQYVNLGASNLNPSAFSEDKLRFSVLRTKEVNLQLTYSC